MEPSHRVLGILAIHNLTQNFLLNERGYVSGNLGVTALLIGIARRAGLTWEEMGLGRPDARQSALLAATATAVAAGVATIAVANPRVRVVLEDERAKITEPDEIWRRVLLRFPLGTAFFEEMAFRGVLAGLLRRSDDDWRGDLISAGMFAVWHLIPTARALSGNPLGQDRTAPQRISPVVVGSAAAGVAGLGFSWLRRRTGSLLAPWLVHASLNSISFLAGVAAQRKARSGRSAPTG